MGFEEVGGWPSFGVCVSWEGFWSEKGLTVGALAFMVHPDAAFRVRRVHS